jgi:nucleoid-associated protein YgaU
MLLLGAALGALGGGPLPASERSGPAASLDAGGPVYVVQPGDTLWSIATRLDPGADPRPLVDRLVAAHGSATLHVGEVIRLPAEAGP